MIGGCMAVIDCVEKNLNVAFSFVPRRKPVSAKLDTICLIAHRGAHNNTQGCFENTDAAFSKAMNLNCWGIELDIHATKDNILVVNHDPTLDRLWGVSKRIDELSFEQLRQMVPDIPSLAEIVSRYGKKMHLFIELKAPFNNELALQQDLHCLEAGSDYHLLALEEPQFAAMQHFPRSALLLVAGHNNTEEFCRVSLQKGYGGVLGHYLLLSDKKIARLRGANQKVGVGFVDSRFSLYRETNRKIQWLFSNQAERVSHYLP